MKFTSKDLMKAMGLQVGDKVKIETFDNSDFEVCEAYDMGNKEIVLVDDNEEAFGLTLAFGYEYDILPKPKRVGQLTCREIKECRTCPLQFVCNLFRCSFSEDNSLYNILTEINVYDQEIHDLLKARLDKEVMEE